MIRRWTLWLGLCWVLALGCWGQSPWYYPQSHDQRFVNPHLTPQRALGGAWQPRWEGQLVLWLGTAHQIEHRTPQRLSLQLEDGRRIPVRFSRPVRNLQADRRGALVAVKGHVRRDASGTIVLEGRSLIPWRPPGGFSREGGSLLDQWIAFSRPELSPAVRRRIADSIEREAAAVRLDPLFLAALMQIESGFDPQAVSSSGALGLGQLMPQTAQGLGVDPTDIEQNIRGSARMIGGLVQRYSHRPDGRALALASYNAGPTLVARTLRVPPYEETVNYVYFIGALHRELVRQARQLSRPSSGLAPRAVRRLSISDSAR